MLGNQTLEFIAVSLAVFAPLLAVPLVLAFGPRLKSRTGLLALPAPLVSAALTLWVAGRAGDAPSLVLARPWVSSLGVDLSFLIDGVSIFFGLVISGVGALICWYAKEYLSDKYQGHVRFYCYLLLFMTAMLGTVFSENLLLLFIFWEITGIASFLLIGFSHDMEKSRVGARQALLVTATTGLCMLAGVIMLGLSAETYSFSEIDSARILAGSPAWVTSMCVLLLLGAFGKSAQFPFFFWLPGAMAAPTPVSAYLHSATMVKLGIFLTARLHPLFSPLELWFWGLCSVGFFTMLLGAYLALYSDDLKAILAYTTISHLGFLMGAYGVGSRADLQFDLVHILSHVFYKGSLFMIVGIVEQSTNTRDVRVPRGLAKAMPWSAFAAVIGLAALAGIPLSTGFISKEILLADLAKIGGDGVGPATIFTIAAALSAAISVAVALRVLKIFRGTPPPHLTIRRPSLSIQLPPVILASGALVFGIFPGLLEWPVNNLKVAGLHSLDYPELALWHGFSFPLFVSLGALVAGTLLYLRLEKDGSAARSIPNFLRFAEGFELGLEGLNTGAKRLTKALKADWPPMYIPIVLSFLIIVFTAAVIASPESIIRGFKSMPEGFFPVRTLVAVLISIALFGVVAMSRWTAQLVSLSAAGFLLTFYFMLYRAPDLVMTQLLVESASVVMILLLLSRFPSSRLLVRESSKPLKSRIFRNGLAVGVGTVMFLLTVYGQSHRHPNTVGERILALSSSHADGYNAVNTTLVDFRGFDTMGEITVLFIATLGALGLMMRYRREHTGTEPTPPGFLLEKEHAKR